MSSTQLSLDDFSLPKQQTQYDLAMALSIKAQQQHSSYYSHSGLDAYMTGSHPSRHIHHPSSSASAYPYMPEQPTQFSAQYFDGNVPLYEVQPGPHSFTQMQQRPPSPPLSYASTGWHAADGYTNFHPDPPP
ncbi:hypothetical protein A0H81_00059 [Grifola frondosa]|uniref:Uncharacterized protein n=1 Tax=Grifola frondosa TaxID=5627 RepID=A0A1C7MT37_GRIFR|nr:hypothetical protein A0H81_00059 [Grifola frondosa]